MATGDSHLPGLRGRGQICQVLSWRYGFTAYKHRFFFISFADPDLDVKFHVKVRRKASLPHIKTFSHLTVFFLLGECCGSGSGIQDPGWVKIQNPDPG
jgi:hypothetical protein